MSATNIPPALQHGKPPGVVRIEAIASQLTTARRWVIFSSIFLVSYVTGLDFLVRGAYVPYATSSFSNHSLLSTINVLRAVVAAAVQPCAARLTDVFGRVEVYSFAILLSTVGTVAEAVSVNVQGFAAGAVLHQLGYTLSALTIVILIADITSVKNRMFFTFVSNWPFLINCFIGGNITSAVLSVTTWRWGIGMFAIMIPASALPLVVTMLVLDRQAKQANAEHEHGTSPFRLRSVQDLLWELDVIGVLILTAALAMTLVPLTLAGGQDSKWQDAGILAPLIIGVLLLPAFVLWESRTISPVLPLHLLRDRTVWACLTISCAFPFAFMVHGNYLFSLLVVSYDFSIEAATRVASLYSFCAVVSGTVVGVILIKVRRLKAFILAGILLWFVGAGLVYHYRGGADSQAGLIGGEIVIGTAAGLFSWTTLVMIQTAAQHQVVGILISLVFTVNSIGQALGNCVSGAIWSQTLFGELRRNLGDETLAASVYASPLAVVPGVPLGSPERDAIVVSYRMVQRVLTIVAMCVTAVMLVVALFLRDPVLSDRQTQPEADAAALDKVRRMEGERE
ncbi:hypothetical protein NLU13_2394 [Sarocladium strictum]|uniref:Major facilitator superfamily (MFS) profile domain-containing protein n=1 Tax=Sarocladium strictum TaxID=5046 RepID=A0AA39LD86_SARSR|nr:hypothetical protein NLU13_2394 [Sarocladium strictum]